MVEIVFVLRGRTVAIDEVEDMRERAILREIERSLTSRIGAVRCAKHDAYPRLTATGTRVDALSFDVSGCCQDLLTKTAALLA